MVCHVDLAAAVRLGGKTRSMVAEPSLSWIASHRAPADRSGPRPGLRWRRNGTNGCTPLVERH
jgi:hypothetical protein